jgi:intein/homing endonuclease
VEVQFVGGITVKCTPDHMFLTEKGWKFAFELTPNLEIQSGLTNLRNTSMEADTDYIETKSIYKELMEVDYIKMFGNLHLAIFQKDAISIIKTEIQKIINYIILNVLMLQNIYHLNSIKTQGKLQILYAGIAQRNGINQLKEDYGIVDMQKELNPGQNGKEKKETVSIVRKNLIALFAKAGIHKNTVTQIVKPLLIEGVKRLNQCEDVWCLTVPEIGHFCLENGAVVHNCDAFRYVAMSRQHFGGTISGTSLTPDRINDMRRKHYGY